MRHIIFLLLVVAAPAHAVTWHSPEAELNLVIHRVGYHPDLIASLGYVGELWAEETPDGLSIRGEFQPAGENDTGEPSLDVAFQLPISFAFGPGIELFRWGGEEPRINPYHGPIIENDILHMGLSGIAGPFLEMLGHPPFGRPDYAIAEGWVSAPLAPIPEPTTAALLLSGLLIGRWKRSKTRPFG